MRSEDSPAQAPPPTNHVRRTAITILVWFAISNTIILSTKWLFDNHFPFPLTVTTYSNVVSTVWAVLLSRHPTFRAPVPSRQQIMSYIVPIGVMSALEIGCSNIALKLLTVSFGTILKGGAPVFTFMCGLFLGLEQFSLRIFCCLLLIAIGIALASLGEGQQFPLLGFCFQLFATALGGLRWAMTHKLLQEHTNTNTTDPTTTNSDGNNTSINNTLQSPPPLHQPMSPLTATLYTSRVTTLCVLPFALALEGPAIFNHEYSNNSSTGKGNYESNTNNSNNNEHVLIVAAMTAIATLVFILLMSEYWLVKATSSLALSVAGTFKELLTIGGGILFFADHIGFLNVIGFITCQVGILLYIWLRYERPTVESYTSVVTEDAEIPFVERTPHQETFANTKYDSSSNLQ